MAATVPLSQGAQIASATTPPQFTPVDSPAVFTTAIGDFNGDGRDDIIANQGVTTGAPGSWQVELWYGNADGTISPGPIVTPAAGTDFGFLRHRASTADVTGDARADLVVPTRTGCTTDPLPGHSPICTGRALTILPGDPATGFGTPVEVQLPGNGFLSEQVGTADLGPAPGHDLTLIVDSALHIGINDGAGGFTWSVAAPPPDLRYTDVTVAVLDPDGRRNDLVAAVTDDNGVSQVLVHPDGSPAATPGPQFSTFVQLLGPGRVDPSSPVEDVFVNTPNVSCASSNEGRPVYVLHGDGAGGLHPAPVSTGQCGYFAHDIDGDGSSDLLAQPYPERHTTWSRRATGDTYAAPEVLFADIGGNLLQFGDINGDGGEDVIGSVNIGSVWYTRVQLRVAPAPAFVERDGTELVLAGEPFRFTGMNIYHATSDGWCNDAMNTGSALSDALTEMNDPHVIRTWFFQMMGTPQPGVRDWSALDHALQVARDHGVKVIATLGNQWADCDSQRDVAGEYKDASWYTDRYMTEVPNGLVSTYRDWVAEVVTRYKDDPTILAWELVDEPELPKVGGACPTGSGDILHDFAADVSGLVKSIDQNHLVSLGTIGGGQCGSADDDYTLVHSPPGIDLCSVHDYDEPAFAMPGDQWNGMAVRLRQCEALDKPLFVGEAGLMLSETNGSRTQRADLLVRKMSTALRAGAVGHVLWAWDAAPHDFQPGDPVFAALGLDASVWPDDGGDDDLDGISNAVDVAAGFADGNGTSGSILPNQNLRAVILDAPAPAGVSIFVPRAEAPQPLQVELCGQPVTVMSGTEATLTCGSVIANVSTGTVVVPLRDGSFVTIPGGTTATVNEHPDGTFTVSDVAGAGVTLSAAGTVHPLAAGAPSRTFDLWRFTGFASPFEGPGPHQAKAGSTVKLKFTIREPSGTPATSLQRATILVETRIPCAAGGPTPDGPPVTVAIGRGLTHLGSGEYAVEWKTPKTYARSCKLMRLDLGEGITHDTSFIFTK